jgi:tRNA pseudouridine55 synthase
MDGIIVFYKTKGMTSHDAVALLRRYTGVKKVGHTGTLDPMAEGVLPICVGKATRVIEFIGVEGAPDAKAYDCEMKLGMRTDTLDIWGEPAAMGGADIKGASACAIPSYITDEAIEKAFADMTGDIMQIPPAYSAIKYKGKKLYELARRGAEIPDEALKPRRVHIKSIDVREINPALGTVRFSVCCSSGTYVRSLCRDVGEALGCGAVMSALTRTKSGVFSLSDAHGADEIEAGAEKCLLPPDAAIPFLPAVELSDSDAAGFANGMSVRLARSAEIEAREVSAADSANAPAYGGAELMARGEFMRVYSGGRFIGIAKAGNGMIKPYKVIMT